MRSVATHHKQNLGGVSVVKIKITTIWLKVMKISHVMRAHCWMIINLSNVKEAKHINMSHSFQNPHKFYVISLTCLLLSCSSRFVLSINIPNLIAIFLLLFAVTAGSEWDQFINLYKCGSNGNGLKEIHSRDMLKNKRKENFHIMIRS